MRMCISSDGREKIGKNRMGALSQRAGGPHLRGVGNLVG